MHTYDRAQPPRRGEWKPSTLKLARNWGRLADGFDIASAQTTSIGTQTRQCGTNTTRRPKEKFPKLPPLPKDDFKIIRAHQGLPLRNIVTPTLATAIIEACQHQFSGDQFMLRINPGSNIAIFSTKHQEVAEKARGI